ncbi:hypothetical protein [Streptomyces sp. SDr-06]|uniref:hypothetical protein n=1 Tax=Streptomyces sp. SDr-06 TaxID=2267702 RepID=UPI000DEB79D4|nr:hypothetical protein [Streptomyces sp. SDr-06]RCH65154.1 hypothetical protein DT019_28690 [Streptomyces sp. SDr-06]
MAGSRTAAGSAALCSAAVVLSLAGAATAHADDTGSLTAEQISQRSHEALLGAHSLHVTAKGELGTPGSSTSFDLTLDRSGNCRGSVSLGPQGSVEIVKRGADIWMKPDAAFWKNEVPGGGSALASLVGDRYLKGTTSDPVLRNTTAVCDLDTFQKYLDTSAAMPTTGLTKGRPTTVDGTAVIPVSATEQGRVHTLDVAATGKPYPVRITVARTGAAPDATVRFDGFDQPVPSATPSAAASVDLSGLLSHSA